MLKGFVGAEAASVWPGDASPGALCGGTAQEDFKVLFMILTPTPTPAVVVESVILGSCHLLLQTVLPT